MVSIHKRTLDNGSIRWDVRWLEAGKHRRKTFRTKTDAQRFDRDTANRLARGAYSSGEPSSETIGNWLRYWWDRDSHKMTENTRTTYDSLVRLWLVPVLDDVRLRDFGVKQAREFSSVITTQGVRRADGKVYRAKPVTHNRALAVLSSALGKAVDEDMIPFNPAMRVDRLTEAPKRPRVLYPQELEALRVIVPSLRDVCIIGVMAYAGLRVQEAFALRRESIGTNTIFIDRALDRDDTIKHSKTNVSRTVPLIGPLAEDLAAYMAQVPGGRLDLLFADCTGEPLDRSSWSRNCWRKALAVAKVEHATPYDCRHAYASLEINSGTPIPVVSHRMGHASVTTTLKHYTHLVDEARANPNVPVEEAVRAERIYRIDEKPAVALRRQWESAVAI